MSGCAPGLDASEPKAPQSEPGRISRADVSGRPVPAPVVSTRSATSRPLPAASANPLARHFVSNYVQMEATSLEDLTGTKRAELLERLPLEAFAYANTDLDDKSATVVRGEYFDDRFPHKDEPLLLLYAPRIGHSINSNPKYTKREEGRVVVTTVDGAVVDVEWRYLSERPVSNPVVASAPRVIRVEPEAAALKASALEYPDTGSDWVQHALVPIVGALAHEFSREEFWQTKDRILGLVRAAADTSDACRDRASAPLDAQVRAGTWTADAPSGRTITVKSPSALQAERKAVERSDKVCGDRKALQKKYATIYDAEDIRIRARLSTDRARLYERSTARFRTSQR
jgi:hypothetical protein